ncbi:MAG: hypothetical protein HPY74_10205 [Firmicutes bacterium]|nr:hypothetical protein [Bacillota bacterium]
MIKHYNYYKAQKNRVACYLPKQVWREDLNPKIQVIRDLAREFATLFVPLDGIFYQYSVYKPMQFWAQDGVHPTKEGHAVIATAWMKVTGVL